MTALDLKTGQLKVIAENKKADLGAVISHPTENTIEAVSFMYTGEEWDIINPEYQADFDYLQARRWRPLDLQPVAGQSALDCRVLEGRRPDPLLPLRSLARADVEVPVHQPQELEGLPLVKMHPLVLKARDGLDLVCLPEPAERDRLGPRRTAEPPLPLVLDVHGGPWRRTTGATIRNISGWPIAAMPCSA